MPRSTIELKEIINSESAVAVFYSTEKCTVCHVLLPKLQELFSKEFSKIHFIHIDMNIMPKASAEFRVFNAPTLLVFFEGKEVFRKSSNMGVGEIEQVVKRYYDFMFS